MISVTVNFNGVDKKLDGAPAKLRAKLYTRLKAKNQEFKRKAVQEAPEDSGALGRAIYCRDYKNPTRHSLGIAGSLRGPTGFPYAQFVTGGTDLNIRKNSTSPFYGKGQRVTYGDAATSPSGNAIAWTAQKGWWLRIINEYKKSMPGTAGRAVRDFVKEMN